MVEHRIEHIAGLAGFPVDRVRAYMLADWPEGAEHQDWLNNTEDSVIAVWVQVGLRDAD
jgi:hypothetical protein